MDLQIKRIGKTFHYESNARWMLVQGISNYQKLVKDVAEASNHDIKGAKDQILSAKQNPALKYAFGHYTEFTGSLTLKEYLLNPNSHPDYWKDRNNHL